LELNEVWTHTNFKIYNKKAHRYTTDGSPWFFEETYSDRDSAINEIEKMSGFYPPLSLEEKREIFEVHEVITITKRVK